MSYSQSTLHCDCEGSERTDVYGRGTKRVMLSTRAAGWLIHRADQEQQPPGALRYKIPVCLSFFLCLFIKANKSEFFNHKTLQTYI